MLKILYLLYGISCHIELVAQLLGIEVLLDALEGLSTLVLLMESLDFLLSSNDLFVEVRILRSHLSLLLNQLVTLCLEFLSSIFGSLELLSQYILLPPEFLRTIHITTSRPIHCLRNFKVGWSKV